MHLIKSLPVHQPPAFSRRHPASQKLAINTQEGLVLVRWQDIIRCMADSNYTRIILTNGSVIVVSKPLGRVQQSLPEKQFSRVHQSHLVRLDAIRCVGRDEVILEDKTIVPLSRSGRKVLIEHLHETTNQL